MGKNGDDPFAAGGGTGPPIGGVAAAETDRVDVHEHDDHLTVVADLPGVTEDAIDLACDGRTLAIKAVTETQPLFVRADLPAYVDATSMEETLNNGILKITLSRDRDPANIGFR